MKRDSIRPTTNASCALPERRNLHCVIYANVCTLIKHTQLAIVVLAPVITRVR